MNGFEAKWLKQQNACCWKHTPDYFGMLLCPTCGNKRCPKASNCELECTGSNEPNQKGSIYGGLD